MAIRVENLFPGGERPCRSASAAPSSLFGSLMILKAACVNNQCYIDRLITPFMRVLQKMAREHLTPTSQETTSSEWCIAFPFAFGDSAFRDY